MAPSDKSLAVRRQNWSAKVWRASEHGNAFVNARGYNIVVFGSRKGWGIRISQRNGDRQQFGKLRFATRIEAQAAAFEALLWAERTWHGSGRYDLPTQPMQPAP